MKIKLSCVLLTLFTVIMLVSSQIWAQDALRPMSESGNAVLRMISPYPQTHPSTQAAEYFAQLVEKETNSRIHIQVFSNVELGGTDSSLEQMQFGGIAFSIVPCFSLPEELRYADDSSEQLLQADPDALGLLQMTVLCNLTPDYRCIANNSRPLDSQANGNGLTLHTYDAAEIREPLEALGFSVVTLSGASLDSSISHGYIDGTELAFMEYVSGEYFRILPFLSLFDGPRSSDSIIASRVTWGGLSVEDQKIIAECAAATVEYHALLLPQSQAEAMEQLAQYKISLQPPSVQTTPPEKWEDLRTMFVRTAQEKQP